MFPCYVSNEAIVAGSTIKPFENDRWCYNRDNVAVPFWNKKLKIKLSDDHEPETAVYGVDLKMNEWEVNSDIISIWLRECGEEFIKPGNFKPKGDWLLKDHSLDGVILTDKGTALTIRISSGVMTITDLGIKGDQAALVTPRGIRYTREITEILNVSSLLDTLVLIEQNKFTKIRVPLVTFGMDDTIRVTGLLIPKDNVDKMVEEFKVALERL